MRASGQRAARPFISLQAVSFRFGEDLVFRDTHWTLTTQQHWALIGPNGGGKSLLADGLRGHLPAVGGELNYHFRSPRPLLPEQAIGYVSFEERKLDLGERIQQSRWFSLEEEEALTVRKLLTYERVMEINPFEITSGDAALRRAHALRLRRAVNLLRIAPFLDRTLLSLSNGETQRVELAKALCRPLRMLILDEPYIGLDANMRCHVQALLEHLMQTRLRVIIATTRPEDLPRGVTHAAWVDRCQLVRTGPLREMIRTAPDAFTGHAPAFKPRRASLVRGSTGKPSRAPRALVSFRDVTIRYGRRRVLSGFNWTIRQGQSCALVGPNGSGKTTVLSLIFGDHPQAYAQDVEVLGKRRGIGESIWELKRRIGWLSPELQLHFPGGLSCLEVVGSGCHETLGLYEPLTARQRRAAKDSLAAVGLAAQGHEPFEALSPGAQRLVLLARAVVKKPILLIADEPCQGLDATHRETVKKVFESVIQQGGVTVLYATHRPDEMPPSIRHIMRLPQSADSHSNALA